MHLTTTRDVEEENLRRNAQPKLTICFVTTYPPKPDGIATYSDELIRALKSYGHTVFVICNPDLTVGGHEGQEGVYPIIRLLREFKKLAGAKGKVFQTAYKGALAFLVVINDRPLKELARARMKKTQKYEPLHGEGHRFESG